MTFKKMILSFLTYLFLLTGVSTFLTLLKPSNITFTIINILTMLILIITLIKINNLNIRETIKDFKTNYKKYLILILKTLAIGLVFIIISNLIITKFNDLPQNELIIREELKKYPFYYTLNIIIFSPIIEEILFRYNLTIIKNKYIYIIVSTLLFAILHIQKIPQDLIHLISYTLMSLTFLYPFYKTKNILSSIITHSVYNLITLITIIL